MGLTRLGQTVPHHDSPTSARYAGAIHVDTPGVCKHFGWDPNKVCMPVVLSYNEANREASCPYNHAEGCEQHELQAVGGKTFRLADHQKALEAAGLTKKRDELQALRKEGKPPKGSPNRVNGALVWPVQRFA